MRRRIYIAGAYQGPTFIATLANIRRGLYAGFLALKAGYAPFVPWLDFLLSLFGTIGRDEYLDYSMAWLEVSEIVWVIPGWKKSKGTKAEIARAEELGIPVVFTFSAVKAYFRLLEVDQ